MKGKKSPHPDPSHRVDKLTFLTDGRGNAILRPTPFLRLSCMFFCSPIRKQAPAWAAELFECGFPWTAELVRACSEGDFYETEEFRPASCKLAVTAKVGTTWRYNLVPAGQDVPPVPEQLTAVSSAARGRISKPTRWGRCTYPLCTGRAFRPVIGGRGPFLVSSSRMSGQARPHCGCPWVTV